MDYESTNWYQIDLMAHCPHNDTYLGSLVSVNIQVKDVNDNRPIFEADPYKAVLTENMPVGTSVIQVTANDQDTGDDGQVSYRLPMDPGSNIHELFAIDSETGWITTLQELDCETNQIYHFYVVAYDHGRTIQLSSQVLVEVSITDENDNAPRFVSESPPGRPAAWGRGDLRVGSSPCRRPKCLLGSARQALPQLLPLQLLQQVLMLAQDHSAAQRAHDVGEGHPKPAVGPLVWTEPDAHRRPASVDGTGCPPSARRCGRNRMPAVGPPVWTEPDAHCRPAGVDGIGHPLLACWCGRNRMPSRG